jgi:hypothetical protein
VGGARGMHRRGQKSVKSFGRNTLKKNDHSEDGHGWENGIKMDLRDTGWESVKWICLAHDKDQL